MARLILLGFRPSDVDALSRVPRDGGFSDVLVVHNDPRALVLKLASVAALATQSQLPIPRADDVVVAPNIPEIDVLVEPWRRMQARIIIPEDIETAVPVPVGTGAGGKRLAEPPAAPPAPETVVAESPLVPPVPEPPNPSKTARAVPTPLDASTPKEESPMTPFASETQDPLNATALPPANVWESPEATFRYLVAEAAGEQAHSATLWWDGDEGAWVPWLWTGEAPSGTADDVESALEIPVAWGRFRLWGADAFHEKLNLPALSRVAEDLALRDLMTWRRDASALLGHGRPDPHGDTAALARWAEPVFPALGVRAALIWKRTAEGWRLLLARGDGLGLSGELLFPETLMTSTFERPGAPWFRWDPGEGFRAYMAAGVPDPKLPLRLKRMEQTLSGGGGR